MHTQHGYHLGYSLKITNDFLNPLTGPGEPPVLQSLAPALKTHLPGFNPRSWLACSSVFD